MLARRHAALVSLTFAALATLASACGDSGSDGAGGGSTNTSSASTGTGTSSASGGGGPGAGGGGSTTTSTTSTGSGGAGSTCGTAIFDGVDDVLIATPPSSTALDDDFSVGAWIDPAPLAADELYFLAGRHVDGDSNGYYLALEEVNGQAHARFNVFIEGGGTCSASAPVPAGPVHVLGTFDSPDVRIFVDGELAADVECGAFTCAVLPESRWSMGRSDAAAYFPFEGALDDVVYVGRSFTADFDPADLVCGALDVRIRYDFEGLDGASTSVPEVCGTDADAQLGTDAGADEAEPTFGGCE